MHLEEFAEGNSLLHRIDPRVKFVCLMPFIGVVAVRDSIKVGVSALVFSVVLLLIAKVDLKKAFRRLLVVNLFVVLLWFFLPFTEEGPKVFGVGPLEVTSTGLVHTLVITLKTNSIVIATVAILGTSQIFSLTHALRHLRVPEKLVMLFFFFYRYITVMHEEYSRMRRAMKVRGFLPRTDIHTYRTVAYLVGMLLVRSYDRAERVYQAMLCRGFNGRFPLYRHFRLQGKDLVFAVIIYGFTFFLIF